MLRFDAETTRLLEEAYLGADFCKRRRFSFDLLDPRPGEAILDIGCGNGLLTVDLGRAVGTGGRVVGLDPSADMRAAAEARCDGMACVRLVEGRADEMPVDSASIDGAVSVQVFEYLSDFGPALREILRVLRPGGRLVIADIHFDSWIWYSADRARMHRMMQAWDHHLLQRETPAKLPAAMRQAGFVVERAVPMTICDTVLRPDGLAQMMLRLMTSYATENGHVPAVEAEDWAEEQYGLAAAGQFFFALTQFAVVARKP